MGLFGGPFIFAFGRNGQKGYLYLTNAYTPFSLLLLARHWSPLMTQKIKFPHVVLVATFSLFSVLAHAGNYVFRVPLIGGSGVIATAPATQILQLSTSALAFGSVPLQSSATLPITLQNTGTAALSIASATLSGNAAYSLSTACGTLQPGASCGANVTYTPSSNQSQQGTLNLQTGNGQTYSVALSGSGALLGDMAVSATTLDFGTALGNVHASGGTNLLTLKVTNQTGMAASIAVSSPTSGYFSQLSSTCTGALANGASCSVMELWTGLVTPAGSQTDSLTVTKGVSTGSLSQSVALTGYQLGTVSVSTPSFSGIQEGVLVTKPATITNNSLNTAQLTYSVQAGTGLTTSLGSSTCGATLAPGASCTYNISVETSDSTSRTFTTTVAFTVDGLSSQTMPTLTVTGTP